jgi:uncharacterized protein YqgC (DUF456 family)
MLVAKLTVILCMLVGLTGTFIHKVPGTPTILLSALVYGVITGFSTMHITWFMLLGVLTLVAELGSQYIRDRLFPDAGIDKVFGLDVAAGSFASLILTDVLAGPVIGLIIWELIIGKSLMPLIKKSGILVLKLVVAAMFRFSLAAAMIVIVIFKVL